jgi:hypothetical protein
MNTAIHLLGIITCHQLHTKTRQYRLKLYLRKSKHCEYIPPEILYRNIKSIIIHLIFLLATVYRSTHWKKNWTIFCSLNVLLVQLQLSKCSCNECCHTQTLRRSSLNSRHRRLLHHDYSVCHTMRNGQSLRPSAGLSGFLAMPNFRYWLLVHWGILMYIGAAILLIQTLHIKN